MYFDFENNETSVVILGDIIGLTKDFSRSKTATMYIPVDCESEGDIVATSSLTMKIVIGVCSWLFGDDYILSDDCDRLRTSMWQKNISDIENIPEDDKHATIGDYQTEDAFDNAPHITVALVKIDENIMGLINLFGRYESLILVCRQGSAVAEKIQNGLVILIHTTKSKVETMQLHDYEVWKIQQLQAAKKGHPPSSE
jgi:hypothetical protein